jgi:hypothetical protein
VVRNRKSGVNSNIYKYIYRHIVSYAVLRNARMQLRQATKRGALDFGLSNFKWYILLIFIVECNNENGKHTVVKGGLNI